jgi:hypothetical protein
MNSDTSTNLIRIAAARIGFDNITAEQVIKVWNELNEHSKIEDIGRTQDADVRKSLETDFMHRAETSLRKMKDHR